MDITLPYFIFVCVTDLGAMIWFLYLFSSVRLEFSIKSRIALTWRNIFLTIIFGWLLTIGGRTTNWGVFFRYWRAGVTTLIMFVGVFFISDRIFDRSGEKPMWPLRHSSHLIGWVLVIMVLVVWGLGSLNTSSK